MDQIGINFWCIFYIENSNQKRQVDLKVVLKRTKNGKCKIPNAKPFLAFRLSFSIPFWWHIRRSKGIVHFPFQFYRSLDMPLKKSIRKDPKNGWVLLHFPFWVQVSLDMPSDKTWKFICYSLQIFSMGKSNRYSAGLEYST